MNNYVVREKYKKGFRYKSKNGILLKSFKKNLLQKNQADFSEISGISTPRSVAPADHQKHTKVCTKLKISTSRLPKTYKSLYKT